MATIPDFVAPDFVNGQDAETIQANMMDNLPPDIDDTQGGFPWDFTMPTALEKSELIQYQLVQTLKIMFPMWAHDEWVDYHLKAHATKRKAANAATGTISITGTAGLEIPAGTIFASSAVGDIPAVLFSTNTTETIGAGGTTDIKVTAVEAGTGGNVAAGSISIMATPITGITGITNAAATSGGTSEESDQDAIMRLMDAIENEEASYVGSEADYKRWAEAITGVGKASVISEWNGAGTVKIVLVDANGTPANGTIISAVYNDIISPNNPILRKAPIGATVTVTAPTAKTINYSFTLTLDAGKTKDDFLISFRGSLLKYYSTAKDGGTIKYNKIASIITDTDGVVDFTGLTINSGTGNITIESDEYPVTGAISTTGGI